MPAVSRLPLQAASSATSIMAGAMSILFILLVLLILGTKIQKNY